jgi:mono/diheme cytochrome c family protein
MKVGACGTFVCALASVVLTAALAACGTPRRDEPLVGPFTTADGRLQRGRVSFDRYCYKCHGEGEGALGPGMNHLPLPRAMMRMQVRVGLGAMPSFKPDELSDAELDEILDYLVALRRHGR